MKHYTMRAEGSAERSEEADAINDLTEDVPTEAPPTTSLPPMHGMEPDPDLVELERKGKDGMEKALEILDAYEEGLDKRDVDVPQYEE